MGNFPNWEDYLNQVDKIKNNLSNFLISSKINKSSREMPDFQELSEPINIIAKNIYDRSNGSEVDKYVNVFTVLDKVKEQGQGKYNLTRTQLNTIFQNIDFYKIKSNESILKHIEELLINPINSDRITIIRKEVEEVNNNVTNVKIVTDTPITNGVLDFPIYSNLISNIIENSNPRFSVGIFGGWGTGKTTLMTMIKNKLEYIENISWKNIVESLQQCKLKKFIRDTYNIDWIDNAKFQKIDENILNIEDSTNELSTDSKGSYSFEQFNRLTITINDDKAIINYNNDEIELKIKKEENDTKIYLTDKKILTVWFDAWRYEQEENLPVIALIRSISLTVEDFILSQQPKELTYWEAIKNSLLRSAIAFISSSKITYGIKDVVSIETNFKTMLESFKGMVLL